jgi:hypothetical protein
VLGERLPHGGDATAGAVVAQRQVPGHDGSFDTFWRLRRVVLGSFGAFLGPGGLGCVGAIPPRGEPALRAGQRSTALLNLGVRKGCVDGLGTTVSWALGPRHGLCERRVSLAEPAMCSMSWHLGWRVPAVIQALRRDRWGTRHPWRRQHRCQQEPESMSHQRHGSGRTPSTLRSVQRRRG